MTPKDSQKGAEKSKTRHKDPEEGGGKEGPTCDLEPTEETGGSSVRSSAAGEAGGQLRARLRQDDLYGPLSWDSEGFWGPSRNLGTSPR